MIIHLTPKRRKQTYETFRTSKLKGHKKIKDIDAKLFFPSNMHYFSAENAGSGCIFYSLKGQF
jgi:hypothetical protein